MAGMFRVTDRYLGGVFRAIQIQGGAGIVERGYDGVPMIEYVVHV